MGRSQDRALKLFVVLSRACGAIAARADADASRSGLTMAEFAALEALYHKGALLVGELQRAVLKSSGGITYVVDRLQQKGLVVREPCATDRRALYAVITDAGRALMDDIFPGHAAEIEAACSALSASEQAQAIELLRRLGQGAEGGREPAGGVGGRKGSRGSRGVASG